LNDASEIEIIMWNKIGPLIGLAIDSRSWRSGIRGALVGAVAQTAGRAAIQIAALLTAGWLLKRLVSYTVHRAPDSKNPPLEHNAADASQRLDKELEISSPELTLGST